MGHKGWIGRLLSPRAGRRPAGHFVAYRLNGLTAIRQSAVRDISSTGAYLLTDEPLQLGAPLSLTMQKAGPLELSSTRRITTRATVARVAQDGVGIKFVMPADQEERRWSTFVESLVEQTQPQEMLTFLGICDAVAFLSRICPRAPAEIEQLFHGRLSNHKVKNAVGIALKAENLLLSEPDADRLRADPGLVVRILEVGACIDDEPMRAYWAGHLAVCCRAAGNNDADLLFVDLFSQLTLAQIRIVTLICARTSKERSETGTLTAIPSTFKTEELAFGITLREAQIERDLEILSDIGLLRKGFDDSRALLLTDTVELVPTHLALELYCRCQGYRGTPEDFYS
jgi:hypothetical protein